ncbi:MAG: hypothetical protein WC787_05295 [Patescibacteria group bacterium]|jgi:hypothetical protein
MVQPKTLFDPQTMDLGGAPHLLWFVTYRQFVKIAEMEPPVPNAVLADRNDLETFLALRPDLKEWEDPIIVRSDHGFTAALPHYGFMPVCGIPYWSQNCCFLFKRPL